MATLRLNTPDVIHESFDQETVIVNLRAGLYFSLDEAGLPLWTQIEQGASEADLRGHWQAKFGNTEGETAAIVRQFLQELAAEELIVLEDLEPLPAEAVASENAKRPVLQKFNDLQDLLMLDPIHDVDERGWPHAKPEGEAPTTA